MRWLVLCTLVLCVASSAWAVNTGSKYVMPVKDNVSDGMADTREGGETYADAYVIPGDVPGDFWTDSGATCDNRDDITLTCASSMAPDVVYQFSPTADMDLTIDLCGSGYDTALEIQDGIGVPIMCNDDYCGVQSGFAHALLNTGHTYYIIVDGFSSNCGSYIINVQRNQPCILECPAGAAQEGEPPCGTDYVDNWNGGCNSSPYVFQPICGTAAGTAVICGKSGTYTYFGFSYRDTDWFSVFGTGGVMTATCVAEFPLQFIFIYGANCSYIQYLLATADQCEYTVLGRVVGSGVEAWMWVGPNQFSGVPCDVDYILQMEGIQPGVTPVEGSNWGEIKNLFR
jgi:hypothetical protein